MDQIEQTLMINKGLLYLFINPLVPNHQRVNRPKLLLSKGINLLKDIKPITIIVEQYLLPSLHIGTRQVQLDEDGGNGLSYQELIHP